MASHFGVYPNHSDKFICPKCGQKGSVIWEDVPSPDGTGKQMTRIEGDFYERLAKTPPYPVELVCNGCGAAQPEEPIQSQVKL